MRRLEPGKNIRWEINGATPTSSAILVTDSPERGQGLRSTVRRFICTDDARHADRAAVQRTVNGPGQ